MPRLKPPRKPTAREMLAWAGLLLLFWGTIGAMSPRPGAGVGLILAGVAWVIVARLLF